MSEVMKLSAEEAARKISRRRLLRRALDSAFFAVAFWSLEGVLKPNPAIAATCNFYKPPGTYYCSPPSAGYCSSYSGSYCSGADCAGGCTPSGCGGYFDSANCWCTDVSCLEFTSASIGVGLTIGTAYGLGRATSFGHGVYELGHSSNNYGFVSRVASRTPVWRRVLATLAILVAVIFTVRAVG
jgi:hypothetical protein